MSKVSFVGHIRYKICLILVKDIVHDWIVVVSVLKIRMRLTNTTSGVLSL